MAEYDRGIKAGIVAGIVYAMIDSVIFFIMGPTLLGISPATWATTMLLFLGNLNVGAIVGGITTGLIYAALYEELPTASPTTKGIIVGIVFWFVFGLALNNTYLAAIFFLIEGFELKAIFFGVMFSLFWKLLGTKETKPSS